MQKLLLSVDKVSTWFGKLFAWLIVALTLTISGGVDTRVLTAEVPPAWEARWPLR